MDLAAAAQELEARRRREGLSLTELNKRLRRQLAIELDVDDDGGQALDR